ncbi:conserved hypothetical protein [Flavobacterium sp. 9AF]|uniref:EVE domain-containing protein n=1 Tax=Flavobacterium sp. 9AF TaxID=2653142 RepID=UPI0012EFBCA0|nr:EVE domain-containing protein [Flavobacterium sp. 9AF]VXB58851.1 conserved hypothetical protein [Flavobacterium sp. 9AF]
MKEREIKYWIIVASKDHVKKGVFEGISQACHGKVTPLKKMRKDDFLIYYSSKLTMDGFEKCQEFTALGKVVDNDIYQVQVSENFCPSRRNVMFLKCDDISILPLIDELDFIQNKKNWGYPFRFGIFEIKEHDFQLISSKMLQNYV